MKDVRPLADDSGLLENVPAGPRLRAAQAPRHRILRWLFSGGRPEPLPSHLGPVEPAEDGKLGICCSGGGIRSAAFSLGALQALQRRGELKRSSYLAAVSGGSYIAAAWSMVAKTGTADSDRELLDQMPPFASGSPEEQYLRNRCSYLAPTFTDKLYLGWRALLGLLFNLIFVSTPLIGLALILTGFFYAPMLPGLAGACNKPAHGNNSHKAECVLNLPTWFWVLTLAALAMSAAFGLATLLPRWRRQEWERFFTTWAVRLLLLTAALALLLLAVPYLVEWIYGFGKHSASAVAGQAIPRLGVGALALLTGVGAQLGHILTSNEMAGELGRARKLFAKLGKAVRLASVYVAAALIGPLLLFAVVVLSVAAAMPEAKPNGAVDLGLVAVGAGVLIAFAVVYCLVDLTTWSLHPYYKRRLSSAFALKRVSAAGLDRAERDRVEALAPSKAGEGIGIAIERDYDELVSISNTALGAKGGGWPTLLICAAANISDTNATPPGRHVTSFTFSANAVGGPLVGAVRMWELETAFESLEEAFPDIPPYAEKGKPSSRPAKVAAAMAPTRARKRRRHDLTLVAAMAMSGAAISPSMGKMTRRSLTFLMALANVRLGVWVPNPRWVWDLGRNKSLRRRYARPRPLYLLCELLGLNRIDAKYLYVTDGGHYENLGLVELLRRGCTQIYCLDASGVGTSGTEFEALGEAIALARSELGVEIEFDSEQKRSDPAEMVPDASTSMAKRDVVVGTIRYRSGHEGRLVYVRNTMIGKAPWDVRAHHQADPRFPNNPTVDQLYTDQKFEAYRVLGERAGEQADVEMHSP